MHKFVGKTVTTILFAVVSIGAVNAELVVLHTPAGSQLDGLPVDVTAVFETDLDTILITLTNNQDDPTSVIQNISDLGFVLSSGETVGSLTSSSGLERTVKADGTYTDGAMGDTGWELETFGAGLRLHVLGTDIGPAHTILGNPGAGDLYNNAKGSIAGNKPHNPFLTGDVTFALSVPGVTEDTTIASAFASFGTTEGNNVELVPEPASGLMLLGLSLLLRRVCR